MNFVSRLLDPRRKMALTRFSKSGRCTPLLVGLLCCLLVGASLEFGHGHLHLITAKMNPPVAVPQYPSGPGGQDILRLSRPGNSNDESPEFLSVTLFPGRGMTVFQITARIPGHGDVDLLASSANVQEGNADGALLLPWAGHLTGNAVAGTSGDAMVQTAWQRQTIRVPADPPGSTSSVGGLLLRHGADSMQTQLLPDGQSVLAVFGPASFAGEWPSSLQVTVQAELEAHELDLTMTARNAGSQPTPIGFGWQPRFAIPGGSRSGSLLTIPSSTVAEIDPTTGLPTGRTLSVAHTARDFSAPGGTPLTADAVDETYTALTPSPVGPTAELRDPAADLLLRLVALTPNITNLRVVAPQDADWISIGANTNLDDPLGPEWGQTSSGLATLAPGESMQWKVRLEIAGLDAHEETK